ncbi:MAG: FtsQ-type POTRA domain-containing protein [Rhodanobacteraceae bacterium]|nr:FtsQ-type POTRA domain-containing protein [Rhodanobacteraceae bacterium]
MSNRRTFVASMSAVLAVTAVAVLIAGAYMAHNGGALLPFRWVDVSGPFARVSAEQIRAAVGPAASRGFFGVDLAEVRTGALSLPWVATAEVRKVWPDTLEISVTEREVLGRKGVDQLVDVAGNVFQARGAGDTRGLPLLDAQPAQMAQLAEYYRLAQDDVEPLGRQITAARMSPRGALELQLNDGLEVHLGSRELLPRWRRFIGSLPRLAALDPRPIAAVDLRYTHGYAVRYVEAEVPVTTPPESSNDT